MTDTNINSSKLNTLNSYFTSEKLSDTNLNSAILNTLNSYFDVSTNPKNILLHDGTNID